MLLEAHAGSWVFSPHTHTQSIIPHKNLPLQQEVAKPGALESAWLCHTEKSVGAQLASNTDLKS